MCGDNAMRARTDTRKTRDAALEAHHYGAFFKSLKAPVGTAPPYRKNQERLPGTHRLDGFFETGNRRFLLRAIDRNKLSQMKCLSDDRIREQRFLQQDRNSPWYRADYRGSICSAGSIRNEQTSAGCNSSGLARAFGDACGSSTIVKIDSDFPPSANATSTGFSFRKTRNFNESPGFLLRSQRSARRGTFSPLKLVISSPASKPARSAVDPGTT